jgi:heat shock protein HslJ
MVESWIEFTDSTHTENGAAYKYPVVYRGTALINYFSGSYQPDTQAKAVQLSETIKTRVNGTAQVKDFETRFHNTLSGVEHYQIVHNELFLVPNHGSVQLRFVAVK